MLCCVAFPHLHQPGGYTPSEPHAPLYPRCCCCLQGQLAYEEVQRRVAQFVDTGLPVLVTAAPLLVDKARLLPGSSFVVSVAAALGPRPMVSSQTGSRKLHVSWGWKGSWAHQLGFLLAILPLLLWKSFAAVEGMSGLAQLCSHVLSRSNMTPCHCCRRCCCSHSPVTTAGWLGHCRAHGDEQILRQQ